MKTTLRSLLSQIIRAFLSLMFGWLLGFFFVKTGSFGSEFVWPFVLILTFFLLRLKPKSEDDPKNKKHLFFWFIVILISFPFALLKLTLGANDIEPIILFFRDNGIEEARAIGRGSFQVKSQVYAVFLYLLVVIALYFNKRLRGFQNVLLISGLAYLCVNPISQYIYRIFVPNPILANFKIDEHFVEPVFTKFPATQKNMVIVYLESLEQTYAEIEQTKEKFSKVDPLMADAIVATNLLQTSGSGFTIAGIVSSQCGVPLLPSGMNQGLYMRKKAGLEVKSFYENIECLGDRLSADGYTLSYMNGADARKYSKRSFLSQHGYTRIFDKFSVSETDLEARGNLWGLNDAFLYEHLRKELDFLASQDEPFVLSYLTISTHGPDAFLDVNCHPPPEGVSQIPTAIGCSLESLLNFYDYVEQKGLMDDTIFVVMSDHLAQRNTVYDALESHEQRKNLFFIKGDVPAIEISKMASPIDIYPTLLEVLGYELRDRRANMGVSMLSENQSMIQKYNGVKELNKRFYANHALGNFLWNSENR
jgi:phosphoglycerol transferase